MSFDDTQFIVFGEGHGWFNSLFDEVKNNNNFLIGNDCFCPCWETRLSYLICHFFMGEKFYRYFKNTFIERMLIKKMCRKLNKRYPNGAICIINRTNYLAHNRFFLKRIKKTNPNIVLVYWFTDVLSMVKNTVKDVDEICEKYYDHVITYEKEDAILYNYHYVETPYSKKTIVSNQEPLNDFLYIGKAKLEGDDKRYHKLISIYKNLKDLGYKLDFSIIGVPKEKQVFQDEIIYNVFVDYDTVLSRLSNSKYIIEVSQTGEKGTTLRMFESLVYRKKLLFTNKNLMNHPYYNPSLMMYIEEDDNDLANKLRDFIKKPIEDNQEVLEKLKPIAFLKKVYDISYQ